MASKKVVVLDNGRFREAQSGDTPVDGSGSGLGGSGGLPAGGTTGQVLTKQSGTDGDADWDDVAGGSGLTHPQVLARGCGA